MKQAFTVAALLLVSVACVRKEEPPPSGEVHTSEKYKAKISWVPNHDKAVNSSGGGYLVYYSSKESFSLSDAKVKRVAYESGSLAPTSVVVDELPPGKNYFKIVGYSSLNGESKSSPSDEFSITLP